MKLVSALFAFLFLFSFASAEELSESVDFAYVQEALDAGGVPVNIAEIFDALVSGELSADSTITDEIGKALTESFRLFSEYAARIVIPMLLWAIASNLMADGHSANRKYASYAAYLTIAMSLSGICMECIEASKKAVALMEALTDAVTPVFVTLLALTGGTRTSSLITPMGALASRMLAYGINHIATTLVSLLCALAVANGFGGMRLGRLEAFVKSLLKWLAGAMVGAYIALMSTGGLITGAYDGAIIKGAKYAADSLLPIVGGDIAGTMESIAASAQLVRSAAGIAVLYALCLTAFRPIVHALLLRWGLRLITAMLEPAADEGMLKLADSFSDVFSMLVAVLAAGFALVIILIGAAIGLGARVMG